MENVNNALDNFLQKDVEKKAGKIIKQIDANTQQVCDIVTGKCETIKSKDGLIERVEIDKTYITKEGKILLND